MEVAINMQKNQVTDKTICWSGWRLWQAGRREGASGVHTQRHSDGRKKKIITFLDPLIPLVLSEDCRTNILSGL